jgi:hypothetical protein
MRSVLAALIALLSVAVGVLHVALVWVLFRGNFAGPQGGPPPGAPRLPVWPGILPLPQLFLANFIVYLVLAIAFLAATRARPAIRLAVDLLLLLTTVATLVGWNNIRRPNPRGLGTWAVAMEAALVVLLVVHGLMIRRRAVAGAMLAGTR